MELENLILILRKIKTMGKSLFVVLPFYEVNSFVQINAYLFRVKKDYDKIVVAITEKLIAMMNVADEYVTCSNEWFDKRGANYPDVLEIIDSTRERSNFNSLVIDYYKKRIAEGENADIVTFFWDKATLLSGERVFMDYGANDVGVAISMGWGYISEQINNGHLALPTETEYHNANEKYKDYFVKDKKNYIVFTRNFKKKQANGNSLNWCPNIYELVKTMQSYGINVIGLGFPALDIPDVKTINNPSSHAEVLSLFYNSDGVIYFTPSIGTICYCSNVDIIDMFGHGEIDRSQIRPLYLKENNITKNILMADSLGLSQMVAENKLKEISEILLNRTKGFDNTVFANERKITYLDA